MTDTDLAIATGYDNRNRGGRPRGTPQSPEARAKIAAALKGREITTTWRLRMAEARRRYLARQREAANAST